MVISISVDFLVCSGLVVVSFGPTVGLYLSVGFDPGPVMGLSAMVVYYLEGFEVSFLWRPVRRFSAWRRMSLCSGLLPAISMAVSRACIAMSVWLSFMKQPEA